LITAKPFDGGLRKGMHKAANPSGGVGSSNPHRWRGEQLCRHGDSVCKVVCAFCAVSQLMTYQSWSLYVKNKRKHNLKMRLMVSYFDPHWHAQYHMFMAGKGDIPINNGADLNILPII
jgi:hypothetical protein